MKKKWIAAISSVVLGCSTVMMPFASSFTVNAADTRSGFVTTNGTQFMLDGSTFYYAGTNNYYLNFKPKESVDAVLEDAAEMGLKVIRTWGNLDAGVKTDKVSDKGYTVFTAKRKACTISISMPIWADRSSTKARTACRSWTMHCTRQSRKVSNC